jgi:hypothetical protein
MSRYPEGSLEIAAVLAKVGGQGRSRHLGALVLFRAGLPVEEQAVRDALAWVVQDDMRRVRQRVQRNEFYLADLAHRVANAVTTSFPLLLAAAPPVGATRRQLKERARQRKQWQRFLGAKVAMKYGEPSGSELEEDLQPLGPKVAGILAKLARDDELAGKSSSSDEDEPSAARLVQDVDFDQLLAAREVIHRCATVNTALYELATYYEEAREYLADLNADAGFAELLILPGALADGVSMPAAFAELAVGFASVELGLVQAALYSAIVHRLVAAAWRGFERLADYSHEHRVKLPALPTFEQVELIGLFDLRQHGEEPDDLDLVEVLEDVGVPASPWIQELQDEWARMITDEDTG